MRLNRLDLTRYGKFTDVQLDFGQKISSEPDLHIIYGPNEAGKSTAFAAFLDLLFGIEPRTRYNFLHEKTMQVGADLALSAGRQTLKRIKTNQNSLLDASGNPVLDGFFLGDLGNLTRASYATMFSLDDKILEKGGEEIIASKGDLGLLLYGASAGLSDLSDKLSAIRAKAEGIFKKGGSKNKIAEIKNKLTELKAQKDTIDTLAQAYDKLIGIRDHKADLYTAALIHLGTEKARLKTVNQLLAAYPHLVALRRDQDLLKPFPDYPEPPPAWYDQIIELQSNETKFQALFLVAEEDVKVATQLLVDIHINEIALKAEAQLKQLGFMQARYLTADKDIPTVEGQANTAGAQIATILNRLEQPNHPDPSSLLIGLTLQDKFRHLIETHTAVEDAEKAAKKEEVKAKGDFETAQARLAETDDTVRQSLSDIQIAAFSATIGEAQSSDHETRNRLAIQTLEENQSIFDQQLRQLQPWQGNAEDLAGMPVPPPAELQRWKTDQATATTIFDNAKSELQRLENQHNARLAVLNSMNTRPGVAADKEASIVRAAREKAWSLHRTNLALETADAFEVVLRHDDFVTAERHAHATEVAAAGQAKLEADNAAESVAQAKSPRDNAQTSFERINSEIATAIRIRTPGLPEDLTLIQWEEWLARRLKAVETWNLVQKARRDIDRAKEDGADVRNKILSAFESVGLPQDRLTQSGELLRVAQVLLSASGKVKLLTQAVSESESDLKDRTGHYNQAKEARLEWEENWKALCQSCWLGNYDTIPTTSVVGDVLKELPSLESALAKKAEYVSRVEAMREDQTRFEKSVAALAEELNVLHKEETPLNTAYAIEQLVQEAKNARDEKARILKEIEGAKEKRAKNQEEINAINATKLSMTEFFGVTSLGEVSEALSRCKEQKKLQDQVSNATTEILKVTGYGALEEAKEALDKYNRQELETEHAKLETGIEGSDQELREIFAEKSNAQKKIDDIGGDDAVAKIEVKRRTLLMEVEESAVEFLKLRIGSLAAEKGLRLYREEHRTSMMKNASDAFKMVSRGHYSGLSTQPDKDAEVLIAKGNDGSSKFAADLSTATRLQLYLALRVAGYQEFAARRPSLPFIADDIIESFDNFRAEEAFRLFTKMAMLGQVIYLTHHMHLIPIAQEVCPTVRIQYLPSP